MRNYIIEKISNAPLQFKFGGVEVNEFDPMPDKIDTKECFRINVPKECTEVTMFDILGVYMYRVYGITVS